jgi:Flp pilus assembly protein TadD
MSYKIKKGILLTVVAMLLSESASSQPQQTGHDYLKRGLAHFNAGEFEAALAETNVAITLSPTLVEAYRLRHMIRYSKDPANDYADDCDMIIRLAPDAPTTEPYYVCRGNARARKLDWRGATSDITRAIAMNPGNGDYYNIRAFTHLWENDLVKARVDYDKSLQIKPNLPSPFVRRGYFRYRKGDFAGAIDDFTRAIEWKPDYAEAYADRGFVFTLHGNIDRAILDIKKAFALKPSSIADRIVENSFGEPFAEANSFIRAYPTNARAYLVRGMFNLLQNRLGDATNDFDRARKLQPRLSSAIDRVIAQLQN